MLCFRYILSCARCVCVCAYENYTKYSMVVLTVFYAPAANSENKCINILTFVSRLFNCICMSRFRLLYLGRFHRVCRRRRRFKYRVLFANVLKCFLCCLIHIEREKATEKECTNLTAKQRDQTRLNEFLLDFLHKWSHTDTHTHT